MAGQSTRQGPSWVRSMAALVSGVLVLAALFSYGLYRTETSDFMVHYHVRRPRNADADDVAQPRFTDGNDVPQITTTGRGDVSRLRNAGGEGAVPQKDDVAEALQTLARLNTTRNSEQCHVDWKSVVPARLPRHPQGRCFVSDKYKLVFILVPKAGSSTSREICLRYNMQKTTWRQLTAEQKQYFKFGFWRDPVARMPSAYSTLLSRSYSNCDDILQLTKGTDTQREQLCRDMFAENTGFYQFIDDLESFAGWTFDEHVRPQTTFFALEDGSPMPLDFITNIEHLTEAWLAIAKLRQFDPPLEMVKTYRAKEGKYHVARLHINTTHTPQTEAAMRRMYRQDFCCFDECPSS